MGRNRIEGSWSSMRGMVDGIESLPTTELGEPWPLDLDRTWPIVYVTQTAASSGRYSSPRPGAGFSHSTDHARRVSLRPGRRRRCRRVSEVDAGILRSPDGFFGSPDGFFKLARARPLQPYWRRHGCWRTTARRASTTCTARVSSRRAWAATTSWHAAPGTAQASPRAPRGRRPGSRTRQPASRTGLPAPRCPSAQPPPGSALRPSSEQGIAAPSAPAPGS